MCSNRSKESDTMTLLHPRSKQEILQICRFLLHLHSNSGPPVHSQFWPYCYSDEPIISLWRRLLCVSALCVAHRSSPRTRSRDWEGRLLGISTVGRADEQSRPQLQFPNQTLPPQHADMRTPSGECQKKSVSQAQLSEKIKSCTRPCGDGHRDILLVPNSSIVVDLGDLIYVSMKKKNAQAAV